jgi:agmatinase
MTEIDVNLTTSSEFGIFGIPCEPEKAQIHIIPVPWEVTTSYGAGASQGPTLIRRASEQVDFLDLEIGKIYQVGIYMHSEPQHLAKLNNTLKPLAQELITLRTSQIEDQVRIRNLLQQINQGCHLMTQWVYEQTREILKNGKWPVVLGGDHSAPLGAIKAIAEHYKGKVGVLHIDAHADLRKAYQGFSQSHASIMHNVLQLNPKPQNLVQVGIRDFCEEEYDYILGQSGLIRTFFDLDLKREIYEGQTWNGICQQIVSELPDNIYVSFDIDGLDPSLCPGTGTPVPGGLSFNEACHLLFSIHRAGKKIVGFDINEVSSAMDEKDDWNGNVGARLLYKMCGWLSKTQRLI